MSGKSHIHFSVKGTASTVCAGGCGNPVRFCILAIPLGEQKTQTEFPKISTCGKCKVSYGEGMGDGKEKTPGTDLAERVEEGVKTGADMMLAFSRFVSTLRGYGR